MPVLLLLGLVAALLTALPAAPALAQTDGNVSIIKDNEAPSNSDIALRLSEETDAPGSVQRVLISRDDDFADALASGLLQGDGPLLLVPRTGDIPPRVMGEIQRLGAGSAVILGGVNAVGSDVESQLRAGGLTIERREGRNRIETAIEIARTEAPQARTAILARAFPAAETPGIPQDRTQGFADALGAGGLAAEEGWPILLSDTDALSADTRAYLERSDIEEIRIVGGTAALSAGVEAELQAMGIRTERVAGTSRGGTAREIAKERGAQTAADVAHVILVDGTGPDAWAGGFASARRAAVLDAPILLADGVRLLPESEAFLAPGSTFAQAGELTVTCVVHPLACTEGRRSLGLIDYPLLTLDPPRGSSVQPGQQITLTLSPASEGADVDVFVDGSCVDPPRALRTDAQGQATLALATSFADEVCFLTTTYASTDGIAINRATLAYTTRGEPARTPDEAFVASDVLVFGSVVPVRPVMVNDTITCTHPGGAPVSRSGWSMQALDQQPGAPGYTNVNIGSNPLRTHPDSRCTFSITAPPEASRVFWGLYGVTDVSLRVPLELGTGTTAEIDLAAVAAETGVDTRDVSVRWVVQMDDLRPTAPQPLPPGEAGVINNPDGVAITCDGVAVPPGITQHPVGADCRASVTTPGLIGLLVQPDRDNVRGHELTFSPLPDTRWTTVRSPLLYQDGASGFGDACAAAMPEEIGRITGGAVERSGEPRFHAFEGRQGEALRIRLDAVSSFDGLDPLLGLFGPDGSEIAVNDDESDLTTNSRIDATLPQDGTYCVVAAGFGGSTGTYLLAIDPAPLYTFDAVLSSEQPRITYAPFEIGPGEVAVVEMRAVPGSGTDPFLEVYDLDGGIVTADDDGGGFPNARIEFASPGSYELDATTYDEFSYGPYTLEVSYVGADGRPLAFQVADGPPRAPSASPGDR